MNVEIGRQNLIILFWEQRCRAVSFLGIHKLEPQTFILDHRPFICSVLLLQSLIWVKLIFNSRKMLLFVPDSKRSNYALKAVAVLSILFKQIRPSVIQALGLSNFSFI